LSGVFVVMAAIMVFIMTFIITLANVGWVEGFTLLWLKAFVTAYMVAVPIIFFWRRSHAN
jgi:hypothetical protein